MTTYDFTIIASGLDWEADDFEDRFFEAACDDATLAVRRGLIHVNFAREAESFEKAVLTAIRDVKTAGATPVRLEPDHLVTMADVSRLSGLSRAAISLYAKGERGSAFPAPAARVTSDNPLWDWHAVATWLLQNEKVDREVVQAALVTKEANVALAAGGLPDSGFAEELRACA